MDLEEMQIVADIVARADGLWVNRKTGLVALAESFPEFDFLITDPSDHWPSEHLEVTVMPSRSFSQEMQRAPRPASPEGASPDGSRHVDASELVSNTIGSESECVRVERRTKALRFRDGRLEQLWHVENRPGGWFVPEWRAVPDAAADGEAQ